jgi:integral membrane protein
MKKAFRIVSLLEGISFILLLFIATPLKYYAQNDVFVKMLGMPHGILFLVYITFALLLKFELKWSSKTFWLVIIASVIPFGTFYIDQKYLKN